MRAWLNALLSVALLALTPPAPASRATPDMGPAGDAATPALRAALGAAMPGARLRVIVRLHPLADQPDAGERQDVRRVARVARLQNEARRAQAAILREIEGRAADSTTLWIINAVALTADAPTIDALTRRGDVASVELDAWRQWIAESPSAGVSAEPGPWTITPEHGAAATGSWGIRRIGADAVWSTFGVTGAGVTVGAIDSGADWTHPALRKRYRGLALDGSVSHGGNWHDVLGESAEPADVVGHGTHVMGTMIGAGGIGVAPGATWIAARAFSPQGYAFDSWLHAAFQFMLAPGGSALAAPDILNNSWGSADALSTAFADDLHVLRQAGVAVVFSAGNLGPQPGSVTSPANLTGTLSVGASDPDGDVARFSGRGPSPYGESRPSLVAPGANIRSAMPGGTYATASGTSMAAPHVAGVLALVKSAAPAINISDGTRAVLSTTRPLSSVLPNNDSGWGELDALSAVASVVAHGTLRGVVRDAEEGQPIPEARLLARTAGRMAVTATGPDGGYALRLAPGVYTVTLGAYGFVTHTAFPVELEAGDDVQLGQALPRTPSGRIRVTATDTVTGAPIAGARVRSLGTPVQATLPSTLTLPQGEHTLELRATGYAVLTRSIVVGAGGATAIDFAPLRAPRLALIDSGAWYYHQGADAYRTALAALGQAYDEYRIKRSADVPLSTTLSTYDVVVWVAPEDAPGLVGGEAALDGFLDGGRGLLLAGQNVALHDSSFLSSKPYFRKLNAYWAGDAGPVTGAIAPPPSPLSPLTLTLETDSPHLDAFVVRDEDLGGPLLTYITGAPGPVAIAGVMAGECVNYRSAVLGFGLDQARPAERGAVLDGLLRWFAAPRPNQAVRLSRARPPATGAAIALPGDTATHLLRVRNTGAAGVTSTYSIDVSGGAWPAQVSATQLDVGPCQSAGLTVTVGVPAPMPRDQRDTLTVTVRSVADPSAVEEITFTTKTPAGILLVDDDRFFNRERDYLEALSSMGARPDVWDTRWNEPRLSESPSVSALRMYPVVVWFNGYDWVDPITADEQTALGQYLDGGGRLFYSSQAALYWTELSGFNRGYLGVAAIDFDGVFSNVIGVAGNPIGDNIAGSMLPFPYGWNLSASVQPMSRTHAALRGDGGQPAALASDGGAWRAVFAPFAVEALGPPARDALIGRAVGWLSPLGLTTLTAQPAVAVAGEIVTFTLALRADEIPGVGALRVALSVPVSAGGSVVWSELDEPAPGSAGEWEGDVAGGEAREWRFATQATAAHTATAWIALPELGLRLSREARARVDAPDLTLAVTHEPARVTWGGEVTLTLAVRNVGLADARATVGSIVPTGMRLVPGSAAASSGAPSVINGRLGWRGVISTGAPLTLTYRAAVPTITAGIASISNTFTSPVPADLYVMARLDDGAGSAAERGVWISPLTWRAYVPVMRWTRPQTSPTAIHALQLQ